MYEMYGLIILFLFEKMILIYVTFIFGATFQSWQTGHVLQQVLYVLNCPEMAASYAAFSKGSNTSSL
jgi:hypothetical protein